MCFKIVKASKVDIDTKMEKKVLEIKKSIENCDYKIDSRIIATKILDELKNK